MGSVGDPLRVTVIGAGYLGLTHAVCLSDLGHHVVAVDVDEDKIAQASRGEAPFFEPGLEPLLRKNLEAGRLRFTTDFAEVGEFGDLHFVCVGTPQRPGGAAADLTHVHSAFAALAPHLTRETLIVGKSTVPVGTTRKLVPSVRAAAPAGDAVDMAFNPEFLREGFAVADSLIPNRLVFGVASFRADELLRRAYATALASGTPALTMDFETAELVKLAANSFLATKISFINVMAEVCEVAGGDVTKLAEALGHDERIGRKFLSAGLGFGGGCLPKDIRAFRSAADELGVESLVNLLTTVDTINLGRRERVVTLARKAVGGDLTGKRIAVLGLAFKPNSDDVRDSPSLDVCQRLAEAGAIVSAHDPVAMPNAARTNPDLRYVGSVADAVDGAEVLLHLTEWADYRALDPMTLRKAVSQPTLIDARATLDTAQWRSAGWNVYVPGTAGTG